MHVFKYLGLFTELGFITYYNTIFFIVIQYHITQYHKTYNIITTGKTDVISD